MSGETLRLRRRPQETAQRGSVTVELVLLTPLLILVLLFVVALGRLAGARLQVNTAAGQAARAASLARNPTTAAQTAQTTAAATLTGAHVSCAQLSVSVDNAKFAAGGWVAVTVSCSVRLGDLTGLRLPATETVTARSVAPLDRYRTTT